MALFVLILVFLSSVFRLPVMGLLTLVFRLLVMVLLALGRLIMAFRLLALRLLMLRLRLLSVARLTMPLRLGSQPLDAPSLVFFPIPISFPFVPVPLNLLVSDALVLPGMASPLMVPVFMPPILGHLSIKRRDVGIIIPTPVIALRTVPALGY